jgi:membrane protein
MRVGSIWEVAKETVNELVDDDVMTLGAALAFYTALGMSPLVVLLLWIATFLGEDTRLQLVAQIQAVVGTQGGEAIRAIVENAKATPGFGNLAGLLSMVTLLVSVSGVFGELQSDLNKIWDVKPLPGSTGSVAWIRKRLLSLGTFVSVSFLLVVSLGLSGMVTMAAESTHDVFPGSDFVWEVVAYVLSLGVTALVFTLVFEVLPDVRLPWRDAVVGGIVTAVLFSIGRWLIGLYLARSSLGSAYGAAGSLIVLLAWVYYASLVVFTGAEVTQVLSRRRGGVRPEPHAIVVEQKEVPRATTAEVQKPNVDRV